MTDHLVERAGGLVSRASALLRRGVAQVVQAAADARESAQARAVAREAAWHAEAAAVELAEHRFALLVDAALAAYRPMTRQADLDAVTWSRPEPSAAILQAEIYRIIAILDPLLKEAGFPLATEDAALRKRMTNAWVRAQAMLQSKAFNGLKLPIYFHAPDGVLDYEPVTFRKDYSGYLGLYGNWSNYNYRHRPVLTP